VAAGVEHIVYLSFINATQEATVTFARDHRHTEEHVRAVGLRHTFLRNNMYLDFLPGLAGTDGVIRWPAGDGRIGAVARDDVADVAVAVLLGEGRDGQTYDVTGSEAITLQQAAEALSRVTGRDVTYRKETLEEAYGSRASFGAPDFEVEGWVTTYTAIAAGEMDVLSDTVVRLTGHAPITLADFLSRQPKIYRHLLGNRARVGLFAAGLRPLALPGRLRRRGRLADGSRLHICRPETT
jgi:NAD(P)H dehydrogenase (quinone)